jgi:hypothetical protein
VLRKAHDDAGAAGFHRGADRILVVATGAYERSRLGSGMDSILAMKIAGLEGGGAAAADYAGSGAAVAVAFDSFGFAAVGD